jgi:hypothetical protein
MFTTIRDTAEHGCYLVLNHYHRYGIGADMFVQTFIRKTSDKRFPDELDRNWNCGGKPLQALFG